MADPKHDGCYFCGSREDELLQSKPIFDITSRHGKALAPHSVAICHSIPCQSINRIDYRDPQWQGGRRTF